MVIIVFVQKKKKKKSEERRAYNQHVHDGQHRIANLQDFRQASSPAFVWGKEVRGEVFLSAVKNAYEEVMHWKPNLFSIPLGAVGKKLVVEMTRLVRAFAEQSALESVCVFLGIDDYAQLTSATTVKFFLSPSTGRVFTAPSQHLGVRKYQLSINRGAGSAD